MKTIMAGYYQHYKGGIYEVITTGKHSETLEDLVIYKGTYPYIDTGDLDPHKIWCRPLATFLEEVSHGIPRFKKVVSELYDGRP